MWRMNKLIGETTEGGKKRNEIKKKERGEKAEYERFVWVRGPGLLTGAERSMIENHKRANETGQAMNEATARISLGPLLPEYELLYHDKRQDRCKWHIYILPSKGELDSIWMKAAAQPRSACVSQWEKPLTCRCAVFGWRRVTRKHLWLACHVSFASSLQVWFNFSSSSSAYLQSQG